MFPVEDFEDYRIRLINGDGGGMGEASGDVIHFGEWVRKYRKT